MLIVLNEEGKLKGLEDNFGIPCHDGRVEVIVGDVAFISYDDDGSFVGLSDEHIDFLSSVGLLE